MSRNLMRILVLVTFASALLGIGVASATPNCRACPYSCSDLGLGKKDCSFVSESKGICCVDLTQKGLEIAAAQEAALKANAATQAGQCPRGFTPRERRCSDTERSRGCKDMRLPNGQGCVKP
ncbi:MAG: hypothetical protein RIS36_1513 [Pseudomonadota bacterium]|jgi:hypothetical protein